MTHLTAAVLLGTWLALPAQADDFEAAKARFEATAGKPNAVRAAALNDLTAFKTEACVRYLDQVRRAARTAFLRSLCLRHIGTVGLDPAREILETALDRGRKDVRPSAIIGLARLTPKVPAKRFLAILKETGATLRDRHAAVRVLSGYPEVAVADALTRELNDDNPAWFRNTTVAALRRIVGEEPCAGWLVQHGLARRPRYRDAVGDLLRVASACPRPELVELVRRRAEKGPLQVRVRAALCLGELQRGEGAAAKETLAVLGRLLRHRKDELVEAAGVALAAIGPAEPALKPLLKLARSRRAGERALAVGALAGVADPRAEAAALKALADDAPAVQFAGLAALRGRRSRPVVAGLIEALQGAGGRLQAELRRSLRHLTGADMGEEHADWKAWWTSVEKGFTFPDPKAAAETPAKRLKSRARPKYYGNEVVSDRVAFIVDISGSMLEKTKPTGSTVEVTRLTICQRELNSVINGLERTTRFNLVAFSNEFAKWQRYAVPATRSRRSQALDFVKQLSAKGGTNIYDPLADALLDPRVDTIWLLTDGDPTAGKFKHREDILREVRRLNATRKVAIHTISVGQTSELLKLLAKEHGGTYCER